jgi:hypothetical protein
MKYYSTWQEAFMDYIRHFGHNYEEGNIYALYSEFEYNLGKNSKGVYFLNGIKQLEQTK